MLRVEDREVDPAGRGAARKCEWGEQLQDPALPCRREAPPGGTRLPLHHGGGMLVPTEEVAGSEGSEWEHQERGEEVGGGRRQRNWLPVGELPLSLPTPSFTA